MLQQAQAGSDLPHLRGGFFGGILSEADVVWAEDGEPWGADARIVDGELQIFMTSTEPREVRYRIAANRQALAALALHQQEFGFTWADVDELRSIETWLKDERDPESSWGPIARIADRIQALLPPKEPKSATDVDFSASGGTFISYHRARSIPQGGVSGVSMIFLWRYIVKLEPYEANQIWPPREP